MPIWMRRNYLQLVVKAVKHQNEANDNAHKKDSHKFATDQQNSKTRIQRPDIKTKKNIMVNPKLTRR
jgi:hypothetical protein